MNKFVMGVSNWEIKFLDKNMTTIKINTITEESIMMRSNGDYEINLKLLESKHNDNIIELIKAPILEINREFIIMDTYNRKEEVKYSFIPNETELIYIESFKLNEIGSYNLIIKNREYYE